MFDNLREKLPECFAAWT